MTKRRISVFYDGSYFTFMWLKALLWAESEFNRLGVDINFISPTQYLPLKFNRARLSRVLARERFDAIFVAHHHSHAHGIGSLPLDALTAILEQLKTQSNTLVWLDTADSTGTCRFEVMPYVDLYFKKQVLKQRERYHTPIWGGRVFCEYYHEKFGVEDPEISDLNYQTLDARYLDKIKISWNLGISDMFAPNKYVSYLRPHTNTAPCFVKPANARTIDAHFRGNAWSSAAGWQRAKARQILTQRTDIRYPDVGTRVSYARYIEEVKTSRAVISPFGWGEVCFRDFEAFAFGATLLKPNMAHLETFPNWYSAGDTYIAIDWDFDEFDAILDDIHINSTAYLDIARNAQSMYKSYISGNVGKRMLAEHILGNLGWL